MERIPVLRMGSLLLVTIQVDMHDKLAMQLQDDVTHRIIGLGFDRRAHRHLLAGNRGLVYRADARRILLECRACWGPKRWWSECSRRLPSRWWNWECRCPAYEPR